jgi:hypothetical protein
MVIEFAQPQNIPSLAQAFLQLPQVRQILSYYGRLNCQTISYDKMNQLRHVKFFGSAEAVRSI